MLTPSRSLSADAARITMANGGAGAKRLWRPVEQTHWETFAGEPTAADAAGPYRYDDLVRMNDAFVSAMERAIARGLERRQR
jgi:hypothetical protein